MSGSEDEDTTFAATIVRALLKPGYANPREVQDVIPTFR